MAADRKDRDRPAASRGLWSAVIKVMVLGPRPRQARGSMTTPGLGAAAGAALSAAAPPALGPGSLGPGSLGPGTARGACGLESGGGGGEGVCGAGRRMTDGGSWLGHGGHVSRQVQGPCSMQRIREWQRAGLFTPSMLVRESM